MAKYKVSEDILVRYRLLKGQELTKDKLAEIKKVQGMILVYNKH